MDIFKVKALTDRMPQDKNIYDKTTRWFRGDRNALNINELKSLRKIADEQCKNLFAAIDNSISKQSKKKVS